LAKKGIVETNKWITKKEEKLLKDIGKVLLRFYADRIGTLYIDDVNIPASALKGKWQKMSLYFKVVE